VIRRWLAALACITALCSAGPSAAAPSYMSYFGLGWNIPEAQDHVNLYWVVSWDWDVDEILSELADAKARGMRAIVHTEFAFFEGSGPYANVCPYTPRPDAAARWDAFAQTLLSRGLLETVAAFYPVDEPDLCGLPTGDVLTALGIIRGHPLTAGKPVAAIFTCDIAKKYGGLYRFSGGHKYGEALRAYDWVGFDCYGTDNIFTDAAWSTPRFDNHCFCIRSDPGPSYYDNFKAQLDLDRQRLILVPQGFISAGSDGLPDDAQLFASRAAADPSVILMAPFTWFDRAFYPGVRSQPALSQQWRAIGKWIAIANPPDAHPPLPEPVSPRLHVSASDLRHFSVYDLTCNATDADTCAIELDWQAADGNVGTRLFMRRGAAAPQLVSCSPATDYVEMPGISIGIDYTFELYQTGGCATTIAAGAVPIASVSLSLASFSPPILMPPANYQGLWWNSPPGSESGWGLSLADQGNTIFAIWFTHDAHRKPWWLAAELHLTATGTYTGDLFTTRGPAFNAVPFDPGAVVETKVGTATLAFSDVDHGTFAYTVDTGNPKAAVAQSKSIVRQEFGPVPACVWSGESNLAAATNYTDLWWNAPASSEPGWGISLAHQGDTIFATWFTYDGAGNPWWLAVAANRIAPGIYAGDLFTAAGPAFNAVPFDSSSVVETTVGTATFTFADGNNAEFAYTVNGTAQSKAITRQVFVAPGTSCE